MSGPEASSALMLEESLRVGFRFIFRFIFLRLIFLRLIFLRLIFLRLIFCVAIA